MDLTILDIKFRSLNYGHMRDGAEDAPRGAPYEMVINYRKYGVFGSSCCVFECEPQLGEVQDMMDLMVAGVKE